MSQGGIGLALSGGGSRAVAFHLGCMRALHDRDLLRRIDVVSGISGGSLLAALWAYGPADFGAFDDGVVEVLRRGLEGTLVRRALRPLVAARNVTSAAWIAASGAFAGRHGAAAVRNTTLTDQFEAVLSELAFGTKKMEDVTHAGLDVVLTATDLRTGGAVRFGSARSSCSRLGTITASVPVATAVASSAAYPVLLPALEREFNFERNGAQTVERVLLSDGGLYDNLGLTVFDPGRSSEYTPHVYDVRYILSCDAGRGVLSTRSPRFLPGRLVRSVDIVHHRAQDGARGRLHEWMETGRIAGFVMAYLGMRDSRLPVPVADLVPRGAVAAYGTNFSAMSKENLDQLSTRGEQLVRALLPVYCPELL